MGETAVTEDTEWINLRGSDGKVKASFNRATGELVIKERDQYHHWDILSFLKREICRHAPEFVLK